MKKSRYTETQIVKILKEVETGRLVKQVCREYGISDATYYNWKSKYGGMEASDVKRLKELEDENRLHCRAAAISKPCSTSYRYG
ncbi:transposase [Vibrio penaeicida]|uniref:transposase n=1 Tax=Vibrio penaeicida TaxID=104609 RepID=UPI0037DDDB1E